MTALSLSGVRVLEGAGRIRAGFDGGVAKAPPSILSEYAHASDADPVLTITSVRERVVEVKVRVNAYFDQHSMSWRTWSLRRLQCRRGGCSAA